MSTVDAVDQLLDARGLTVVRVLRETTAGRTLAVQDQDGTITVLKIRCGRDLQAISRHATELAVYRALRIVLPVGWNAPTLLDADESTLTLQYLPGAPIDDNRYPGPISDHRLHQALHALTALHQWQPPDTSVPSWPCTRVYALHAGPKAGDILTDADRAVLTRLWQPVWARIEHGDPLSGNMLCGQRGVTLVDFEDTGWQPAGSDWPLMDLLWSPGNPALRPHLAGRAAAEGCEPGYAYALLLYAAHELHLYQTMFRPADHEQQATLLAANLGYARDMASIVAGRL
jgi:Phosphotransferase enzyme family